MRQICAKHNSAASVEVLFSAVPLAAGECVSESRQVTALDTVSHEEIARSLQVLNRRDVYPTVIGGSRMIWWFGAG